MDKKVFVVFLTDIHHTHSSKTLFGVFDNVKNAVIGINDYLMSLDEEPMYSIEKDFFINFLQTQFESYRNIGFEFVAEWIEINKNQL